MKGFLFSPRNQLIVYILIIFNGPFIMCQYYLQPLIRKISQFSYNLAGFEIQIVPVAVITFVILIISLTIKKLNRLRISALLFIFFIIFIGQQISDFYMGNSLFDIQSNWHYIAYTIFSYLMFRYLSYRKNSPVRIILYTFLAATLISTLDESFQMKMTNRVFDISDIVKDMLGAVIGLIFVFFIYENGKIIKHGWHFRYRKIKDYFKNPVSLLFLELVFTILFLFFSSVLTEKNVRINSIYISLLVFVIFFLFFHFSRSKIVKYFLLLLVLAQLISFGIFSRKNIVYNSPNLTIYKGIPIPYFDIMFFENGLFRIVDKKTFFQTRDLEIINSHTNDILLIGSGETGKGGGGFPKKEEMQFYINDIKKRCVQVLILKNKNAVTMFNKLKKQKKRVVFILHHEK
ncbi:MAG TPA: VanZ family protein [Candidatus Cloacimonetes bacterium]|nr:VanZ family protein [Candidatus Cloacimonadota bacterium]